MSNLIKPAAFILFTFISLLCNAQKTVMATYSGGHGCVSKSLVLYTDATYEYETSTALLFTHTSRMKGSYLISDSMITLYKRKKLSFLYFTRAKKYTSSAFRMTTNNILIYSQKDESPADSNFNKDYNTLWRKKDS